MFQPYSCEENSEIYELGKSIYQDLRTKYPNKNVEHCDIIFNSLCFALIILRQNNVDKDNYPYFQQLVHKILSDNS